MAEGVPTGDGGARAIAVAALASIVAGGIHLAAADAHLSVSRLSAAFFVLAGIAQAVWAARVLRGARTRTVLVGMATNGILVGLWLASRTIGLPFGPHAWEAEAVGVADALASSLEILIVVLSARALAGSWTTGGRARDLLRGIPSGLAASFGALAATVVAAALAPLGVSHHGHGDHGAWLFHLIALLAMVIAVLTVLGEAVRVRPVGRQNERRSG